VGRRRRAVSISSNAAASVAWAALATCFAVGIALRYEPRLAEVAAKGLGLAITSRTPIGPQPHRRHPELFDQEAFEPSIREGSVG
jgi:hypothetical protein